MIAAIVAFITGDGLKILGALAVALAGWFGYKRIERSGVAKEQARAAAAREQDRRTADNARAEIATAGPDRVRDELRRYQRD